MIDRALEFAVKKHAGQYRKGTNHPYVIHLIEVMMLLLSENVEREIIAAGILHDTLEDTDTTYDELVDEFGETVADLVLYCTEDKTKSWKERKTQTIENMFHQVNTKGNVIVLADKAANLRDSYRELARFCYNRWDKFTEGYDSQKWYHENMLEVASYFKKTRIYDEYEDLINIIFNKVTIPHKPHINDC